MADSANINLNVAATLHYTIIKGDTFAPPPVAFEHRENESSPWEPDDFDDSTFRMQVRTTDNNKRLMKEISDGNGITVVGDNDNQLQYVIDADEISGWPQGIYRYDMQESKSGGIRTTRQRGTITVLDEQTIEE